MSTAELPSSNTRVAQPSMPSVSARRVAASATSPRAPEAPSWQLSRQTTSSSEALSSDDSLPNGLGAKRTAYRNDPYAAQAVVVVGDSTSMTPPSPRKELHAVLPTPSHPERRAPLPTVEADGLLPDGMAAEEPAGPPSGTLHDCLWGRVSFIPYPRSSFAAQRPVASDDLVRVFIGQLPYFVTDMQLSWLCATFGDGTSLAYAERIMKRQPNGDRLPTGCVHAYTTRRAVEAMASGMHKRMLVDDTGVWQATSTEEFQALTSYVTNMKKSKHLRAPNRPYDTMVVQLATSTYIPRHVASKPNLRKTAVHQVADVIDMPRTAPPSAAVSKPSLPLASCHVQPSPPPHQVYPAYGSMPSYAPQQPTPQYPQQYYQHSAPYTYTNHW